MSAFVVSKETIDYVLTVAQQHAGYGIRLTVAGDEVTIHKGANGSKLDKVGRALWAANVKSVAYRYQDDAYDELPGPIPTPFPGEYSFAPYWNNPDCRPTVVGAIKQLHCLEYQSCEHPEWEGSEAKAIVDRLMAAFVHELPGYDDAPWGI